MHGFSDLAERFVNEPEDLKRNLKNVADVLCLDPSVLGAAIEVSSPSLGQIRVRSGRVIGFNSRDLSISGDAGVSGTLSLWLDRSEDEAALPEATMRMGRSLISLGIAHAGVVKRAAEHKASLSAVQVASEALGTIVEEERLYSTVLILIQELMGSEASVIFSTDGESLANLGFDKYPVEFESLMASERNVIRSWRGNLSEMNGSGSGYAVCSRIGRSGGTIYLFRQSQRYRESEEYTLRLVARQLARAQERSKLQTALETTSIEMTESLAAALESRDGTTGDHINRTQDLVETVARRLDLSVEEVRTARFAAVLHDIGKIAVPDAILNKPGKLDEREWEIMRQHPEKGAKILSGISGFERVAAAVLTHHERFDGAGYPEGISGMDIPIEARIISVVDAYDAMTSDRPYRKALSQDIAITELNTQSGKQFDPHVVEVLREIVEQMSEGEEE